MIELSAFQKKCKEQLLSKLKSLEADIHDIRIEESDEKWFAEKEVFIEILVNNLKIWIYNDGAHIQGMNINIPFESPDYDSEEDLIHAFIEKVIFLLQEK
jgi:hypothetical protein